MYRTPLSSLDQAARVAAHATGIFLLATEDLMCLETYLIDEESGEKERKEMRRTVRARSSQARRASSKHSRSEERMMI